MHVDYTGDQRGHLCTIRNPPGVHLNIGDSCSNRPSRFCFHVLVLGRFRVTGLLSYLSIVQPI